MKIDWSGPLTKGRQVYCTARSLDTFRNVNFESGFLIGWDRWSDGKFTLAPRIGLGG